MTFFQLRFILAINTPFVCICFLLKKLLLFHSPQPLPQLIFSVLVSDYSIPLEMLCFLWRNNHETVRLMMGNFQGFKRIRVFFQSYSEVNTNLWIGYKQVNFLPVCINHPLVHQPKLYMRLCLRKRLGASLSLHGWRLWLGKKLWDSVFLWDIGLLSVFFTPWVSHSTK